jgi:hypothetical protein
MPLVSNIIYEPKIEEDEEITPDNVLAMLEEVRGEIGNLDPTFLNSTLFGVIKVLEKEVYKIEGRIPISIDLSKAKEIIDSYRDFSEGGCRSCKSFSKVVLNSDMDTFFFCRLKEDSEKTPRECGYDIGQSPQVKAHYHSPCSSHKPKISIPLSELIRGR